MKMTHCFHIIPLSMRNCCSLAYFMNQCTHLADFTVCLTRQRLLSPVLKAFLHYRYCQASARYIQWLRHLDGLVRSCSNANGARGQSVKGKKKTISVFNKPTWFLTLVITPLSLQSTFVGSFLTEYLSASKYVILVKEYFPGVSTHFTTWAYSCAVWGKKKKWALPTT